MAGLVSSEILKICGFFFSGTDSQLLSYFPLPAIERKLPPSPTVLAFGEPVSLLTLPSNTRLVILP